MADNLLNDPAFPQFAASLEQARGLPAGSLAALIHQESRGNPLAISPAGAQGVAQFMPATAKQYNVDVTNPWDSTRGAADFLGDLTKQYGGNFAAALAHYNGGGAAGRAVAAGHAPPAAETQAYVPSILSKMQGNAPAPQAPAQTDFSNITPDVVAQTRSAVAGMVHQGLAPDLIVNQLAKSVNAPVVKQLQAAGYNNTDIIGEIGGPDVQKTLAANAKVGQQNFVQNAIAGAANNLSDTGMGLKQLAARANAAPEVLKQLQTEQASREADPERQAINDTAGGTVGAVGAQLAPLLIPGVGELGVGGSALSTAARSAALGAALSSTTPTTGDGQIIPNMVGGALFGAGGGAAAHALGNAIGTAGGKLAGGFGNDAKQAALADALHARIGEAPGQAVSSEVADAAHTRIGDMFSKATAGQDVVMPNGFSGKIQTIINDLDSSPKVLTRLGDMADGSTVPAQQLMNIRSNLVSKMRSQSVDGADKQLFSKAIEEIDNHLSTALPAENQKLLADARDQYRHLMAYDNMILKSKDSGVITPQVFNPSISQGGNRSAFVRGNAPYQDLQQQVMDANAKSGLGGLGHGVETLLAVHSPHLYGAYKLAKALGAGGGEGVGRTLAGLGDALNPTQAAALANALGSNAPGVAPMAANAPTFAAQLPINLQAQRLAAALGAQAPQIR